MLRGYRLGSASHSNGSKRPRHSKSLSNEDWPYRQCGLLRRVDLVEHTTVIEEFRLRSFPAAEVFVDSHQV